MTYIQALVIVFIYMTFWFVLSLIKKRNDIADVAWGLGFPLLAALSLLFKSEYGLIDYLLITFSLIWGIRLSLHIHSRNKGKKEDFRYNQWRNEWGKSFYIRTFLQVFMLQGFLMTIIAIPLYIDSRSSFNIYSLIGVSIYLFGLMFESISDYQLTKFIQDPTNKGKIMDRGLWKYSRHPNYFGEIVVWWGIFIFGFINGLSVYAIISPILISYLIIFVSGIPMLEKKYEGNVEFEKYKAKTSILIPLPPK
jgi:steroid 5-alpha reductase family enzyme